MTDTTQLPESVLNRIIKRQNEGLYDGCDDYNAGYSAGAWIAGCAEANRALKLIQAFNPIFDDFKLGIFSAYQSAGYTSTAARDLMKRHPTVIAFENALNEYNQTP